MPRGARQAIEKALTVVTAADERKKLQEAFDSLADGRRMRVVEQD